MNPDKCKINLSEIQGVVYILDATGLRFSEDKLEGVRIFPLPLTVRVHSFLGLVNYFKDHVDSSYIEYSHRLYELLHGDKDQKKANPVDRWTQR